MTFNATHRKLVFVYLLPLVVACLATFASRSIFSIPWFGRLNLLDYQRAGSLRGFAEPSKDIVMITYDGKTASRLGLGPDVARPPRRIHAQLMSLLDQAGAKVALFDIMFVDSNPDDPVLIKTLNSLKTLRITLGTSLNEDIHGHMVVADFTQSGPMYPLSVWKDPSSNQVRIGSLFAELTAEEADMIGGVPIQRDTTSARQVIYAPLAAALQFYDIPTSSLKLDKPNHRLSAGGLQWNLDAIGAIRARWTEVERPFTSYRYEDALALLKNPSKREAFRNKLVIVGFSDPGSNMDIHPTKPFGLIPGVDFVAQMTNTSLLAYNSQYQDVPDDPLYFFCLVSGFAAFQAIRLRKAPLTLTALLGLVALAIGLQWYYAVKLDELFPATRLIGTIIVSALVGLLAGRYWTDKVDLSPPGPADSATVLFLDIKGSTKLLNEIGKDRYQSLLDSLFREYGAIVEKSGGRIERTLGDGFIAIFREKKSRHHALRCADCCRRLVMATQTIARKQELDVSVALGFESGIVGGSYVMEGGNMVWSSSGRTVHLAQRLQSLCGELDITIAVGPVARHLIGEEENCEFVARRAVKGFDEEVEVSRLI